jgi:hypothetical protein
LPAAQQAVLTGRSFFPGLITVPFRAGLHAALDFAIIASLLAAIASWTRGAHQPHAVAGAHAPASVAPSHYQDATDPA